MHTSNPIQPLLHPFSSSSNWTLKTNITIPICIFIKTRDFSTRTEHKTTIHRQNTIDKISISLIISMKRVIQNYQLLQTNTKDNTSFFSPYHQINRYIQPKKPNPTTSPSFLQLFHQQKKIAKDLTSPSPTTHMGACVPEGARLSVVRRVSRVCRGDAMKQ